MADATRPGGPGPRSLRPALLALAFGLVARILWDRAVVPPEPTAPRGSSAAGAPGPDPVRADGARALGLPDAGAERSPSAPHPAPGRPIGVSEPPSRRERPAMSEEERSARNEQLFTELEKEKRRMGIVKVIRQPTDEAAPAREAPAPPAIHAAAPPLLGQTPAAAEPAPAASGGARGILGRPSPGAVLVFSDARSFTASWVLLGLSGAPPAVDFARERAALIKPSASRILSIDAGSEAVTIVYRALAPDEEPSPARDRLALIPLRPRAVSVLDASPR